MFFCATVMRRHLSPVTFTLSLREIIDGQLPRADATTEHQRAIAIEGDNVIILLHLNGNGGERFVPHARKRESGLCPGD